MTRKAGTHIDAVLSKFQGVKPLGPGKWHALCPTHDDKAHSLTITLEKGRDNKERILLHCFVGCKTEAILQAVGLKMTDLFLDDREPPSKQPRKKIKQTEWQIQEYSGEVVATHIRYDYNDGTKNFVWYRNGVKGLGGFPSTELPLYGSESIDRDSTGPIIICEGEKSADACRSAGFFALATVCGAASCPSDEVLMCLMGLNCEIYLWPDNDKIGKEHMNRVSEQLQKMDIKPFFIEWKGAPDHGDAADFIEGGGDIRRLIKIAKPVETMRYKPIVTDLGVQQDIILMSGLPITYTAQDIRRERTGTHAKISIKAQNYTVAYDTFNITRNEDRARLVKSAIKAMPKGAQYDETIIKLGLDDFANIIWDQMVEAQMGKMMNGATDLRPPLFYLYPYIVDGAGTILYAPAGRGKSFITMLLAVSVDSGRDVIWNVNQAPSLFINIERSEKLVQQRLSRVNRILGLPQDRPMLFLNAKGKSLTAIADAARQTIVKHGVQVIFLDSISRAGAGDLNENLSANQTIDMLNSLCQTWFAIGHTPAHDESKLFGSIHFMAGADIGILMSTQESDEALGIGLQIIKANDVKKGQMMNYALEFDDIGLTNARRAQPGEFPELYLAIKQSMENQIWDYLNDVGDATATQIAIAIERPREKVSKILHNSKKFIATEKRGRDQYYGIVFQQEFDV